MSKLLSITLSKNFNALVAQEVEFKETNGIIEVKAAVGQGKTTAKEAIDLTLSAGNQKSLSFDSTKYKEFDNEVQLIFNDKPVFLRTYTNKSGKIESRIYIKDIDGKKVNDPIINGKKVTPAILRDIIKTELSFGSDKFLSENPKIHMDFMMSIYSHKLKAMGVVFDKSAPDYHGSILWRLEQAKLDRGQKEYHKKAVNGFKNHLEAEGWDEQNIPGLIDIISIQSEITMLNNKKQTAEMQHRENQFNAKQTLIDSIQSDIDKLTARGSELMGKIIAYNSGLDNQDKLRLTELVSEINGYNNDVNKQINHKSDCDKCLLSLANLGYAGNDVSEWIDSLPSIPKYRSFKTESELLPPLKKIPLKDGKIESFELNYTDEINEALTKLHRLKIEIRLLLLKKSNPQLESIEFDPSPYNTDALTQQIESAKETNKISERWDSFYLHQEADEKVKSIWKEYCEMFTKVDLGVPGLQMSIVGDENKSEIRTVYDGRFAPDFFNSNEPRLLTQYSQTQRPVIAILLQLYLLEEKIKKDEDGLRLIWVECPTDKKTKDLLISIKEKYNLTIILSSTGDYEYDSLEDGSFLIENGVLLTK